MSDPFEQASLSEDIAPAPVVAQAGPASEYSIEPASRRPALPEAQTVSPKSERSDSIQREPERTETLSPRLQPEIAPSELPNEVRFEQAAPRAAAQPLPQTERTAVAPPTRETHESGEANTKRIADNDERLAEIEREQGILLRKSDAFMRSLLGPREAPTKRHDVESEESEPRVSSRREESEQPKQSRLQPSPPAPREREPDDHPSLVIGSLTVEVVPPAPAPPVTPRREVVIVRGAPTVRSAVPSSRRFGLGQF